MIQTLCDHCQKPISNIQILGEERNHFYVQSDGVHLAGEQTHWDFCSKKCMNDHFVKDDTLEAICKYYHDVAARELVLNNPQNLITNPIGNTYIDWDHLDEAKKEGRRIMMRAMLKQYRISLR